MELPRRELKASALCYGGAQHTAVRPRLVPRAAAPKA